MEWDQCSEQRARLPQTISEPCSFALLSPTYDRFAFDRLRFQAFLFFDLSLCLTTVMDLVIPEKAEESALAMET